MHTALWDNSPANPFNPDPTQTVTQGMRTTEEMWVSLVEFRVPGKLDRPIRVTDGRADVGTDDIRPLKP